ncbi:MAG: transglycosylase SLT domain-containing protein, partial [Acidimicrobiales bacterium]
PTGRPLAATDPAGLAEQIALAERLIRDPATPADQMTAAARLQQVAYRQLGRHPEWDPGVLARLPRELVEAVQLHADARRQFAGLLSRIPDTMPVWEIVAPEPAENLRSYYREAEATFGVAWAYLAAINLVETGMGRIRGLSTAGAQGPMQFMPATWGAYGEGDINAPRDAILAAGRYLAANGFADGEVDYALFRYNNHANYVAGVKAYARIIELDAQAFYGLYHWEIYYASVAGDLWLPVGYTLTEAIPVTDWVAAHPQ